MNIKAWIPRKGYSSAHKYYYWSDNKKVFIGLWGEIFKHSITIGRLNVSIDHKGEEQW